MFARSVQLANRIRCSRKSVVGGLCTAGATPARRLWLLWPVFVCACAAGPPPMGTVTDGVAPLTVPTIIGRHGALTPKAADALLARRWPRDRLDLRAQAALEEALTGAPLIAGNKLTLLFDGPDTMKEMLGTIAQARDSINLETYIFDQDALGQKFADALIDKQRSGVDVSVMYDSVGTLDTPAAFFERMRAAGVHLLEFNPADPRRRPGRWALDHRDHRKTLIVDGKVAFTGGINISSNYANSSLFRSHRGVPVGRALGWRDTHVKIEGPAVAALQWMFVSTWIGQDAGDLPARAFFPPLAPAGDKMMRVLADEPGGNFMLYKAYLLAIQQAHRTIHITTAYFVPDRQLMDALAQAARRGVDVKLVVPGVSDLGMVFYAGRGAFDELLENGVQIYALQQAVLHAKTAVVDGNWSTIGSSNIDNRSFAHNNELNVMVYDAGFGRDMEAAFAEDLRGSRQITAAEWSARPLGERLREWAARLFGDWL